MKKRSLIVLFLIVAMTALAACGKQKAEPSATNTPASGAGTGEKAAVTLKIGATAVPQAEILESVKDKLKAEGVNLDIKVFTDYVLPNTQLNEKQLDANFFQHLPYLEEFNKSKGSKLVSVGNVHIEPFGGYSRKVKALGELKDGATIAIPNDPSNGARALVLLEKNGLIKLKEGVGIAGTVKDIVENKKNFKIKELEAAMLPRVLDEVDLALINTNYALEAKLVPAKDALFVEDKDSPYANIIAAREDNAKSEAVQKLIKALQTPEVKKFIEDKYQGSVLPAF